MQVLYVLKNPFYALLAALAAIFMLGFYPFIQILPQGLNNFWFWFTLLTPMRWALYILYGSLFGATVSFFIFHWNTKVCSIEKRTASGITGLTGTLTGIVLPQCAACISIAAIFLPTSTALFLVQHTTAVMVFSNLLLFGALYSMGALKRAL